jgi:hypothetical protein
MNSICKRYFPLVHNYSIDLGKKRIPKEQEKKSSELCGLVIDCILKKRGV